MPTFGVPWFVYLVGVRIMAMTATERAEFDRLKARFYLVSDRLRIAEEEFAFVGDAIRAAEAQFAALDAEFGSHDLATLRADRDALIGEIGVRDDLLAELDKRVVALRAELDRRVKASEAKRPKVRAKRKPVAKVY